IHITDPLSTPCEAGGGVLLQTLELDSDTALLGVRVHVHNRYPESRTLMLHVRVTELMGKCIAEHVHPFSVDGEADSEIRCNLSVSGIQLWSTECPSLYWVETRIVGPDGNALDHRSTR